MAPQLPPALMDDVIVDILLRLPPEDIGCLTRASLVCKDWRRILSDRAFFRRYRQIHGAPPFLGFLYNNYSIGVSPFIPTTPASPFSLLAPAGNHTCHRTLDCRHGRVLIYHPGYTVTVWDPVTDLQRCISAPVIPLTAAVLCATNGCDHLHCGDGPYLLVLLAKTHKGMGMAPARASLYSSETRKWSGSASVHLGSFRRATAPGLLAGDALFFVVGPGQLLKYDITSGVLSVIRVPLYPGINMILCTAEHGDLGVATVEVGSCLRLLSGRTGPDGVIRWAQDRAIVLDSMVPMGVGGTSTKFYVVGSAEGTGHIFVRANDSIFSVELKSGRISKIGSGKFSPIFPLMGFYIPGANAD